ncbi:partial Choline-sulfatase, partial [uncultured bacterium]
QIRANWQTTRAAVINQAAMNWIDSTWTPALSSTQPLFLFLYYFDPHTWYDPPPPYATLYDPTYTGTFTTAVYADSENVVNGTLIPSARDVEYLQALYDGEITYWDSQLGVLLNFLETRHVLDNSLIIVTSDHGELFGEHGQWTHRNSVYEEALHVPLIMRYTGVISAGLHITEPVQLTDVTPTILDWLSLSIPPGLDGQSLKPLTQGVHPTQPRAIFSEIDAITNPSVPGYWLALRYELRAVRQGDWKYIYTIGLTSSDALYALQPASLYETNNVILSEPATASMLRQLLIDKFRLLTLFTDMAVIAR